MPTADKPFSYFLTENADKILELALEEGFAFSVKECSRSVFVQCTFPDGHTRFICFDDHRVENPHGGKPHVCNQWYKEVGTPVSYKMGKSVTDVPRLQNVLRAVAVMCLTQTEAYNGMKVQIFL
jgi:hypothetical protein